MLSLTITKLYNLLQQLSTVYTIFMCNCDASYDVGLNYFERVDEILPFSHLSR